MSKSNPNKKKCTVLNAGYSQCTVINANVGEKKRTEISQNKVYRIVCLCACEGGEQFDSKT